MPFPKQFYYMQTQSSVDCVSWNTGNIAILEFLAGKPHWISPIPAHHEKQKSLVLADWTAMAWSPEKIERVKKKLGELVDAGFDIYFWQNGQITEKIGKDQLSILNDKSVHSAMTLASIKDITDAAVAVTERKLFFDRVQVIDDYWLNHLLSGEDNPGPRKLHIRELSFLTREKITDLLHILSSSSPSLQEIIHDEFSEKANKIARLLRDKWPKSLTHDYTVVNISSEFNHFISKQIDLNGFKLSLGENDLENMQTLMLSYVTIADNLLIFLYPDSPLRILELDGCDLRGDTLQSLKPLNQLEALVVSNCNLSIENLNSIIKQAPNLKKINLSSCLQLNGSLELKLDNLKQLEELDVSHTDLSLNNLNSIINKVSNLKKINLCGCQQLNGPLELQLDNLKQLEALNVSYTNLSLENLNSIIKQAQKLKKINLSGCQQLNGSLELQLDNLRQLEELNVSHTDLSLENLNSIIKQAPNLKKINLSGCRQLNGSLELKLDNLKQLEELDVSSTNLSLENLNSIIKHAQKLKRINLSGCRQLNGSLELKLDNLGQLEELDVSYSNLSLINLKSIIKAAPNLKEIELNCFPLNGLLELEPNSLEQLEEFCAYGNQYSFENLQFIIKAAPNLKKINLYETHFLKGDLKLEAQSLKQLEELDSASTNLNLQHLNVLLNAAPNLKILDLSHCDDLLNGELKLQPNSLEQLEELNIRDAFITLSALQILLKSAPNLNQKSKDALLKAIQAKKNHPQLPTTIPINPTHDHQKMKDFSPPKEEFVFKGDNKTKNQGMIIEKLCQYWTKKNIHPEVIPKIQGGICVALAHFFNDLSTENWKEFIQRSLDWKGEGLPDSTLSGYFDKLFEYIQKYQLNGQPTTCYLGDALEKYLLNNSTQSLILANPWHRITLKPHGTEQDTWYVYDPNYVDDALVVKRNDLLGTIHNAIGYLVSVEGTTDYLSIKNPDQFIEKGGLIALCKSNNAGAMLNILEQHGQYTHAALDGLLLRGTSGRPAWSIGLASNNPRIKVFTQKLKNRFELYKKDAIAQLDKSLAALSPMQKGEVITKLVQAEPVTSAANNASLIAAIRKSANQQRYEQRLKTWDKQGKKVRSALVYCHQCLNNEGKSRLIELDSSLQLDTLRVQLEQHVANCGRPVFYIDKPEDLICSAPWIEKNEDKSGILRSGPGGPLYQFLQDNKEGHPLILVNYERFNADDLVRFNSMLDKEPNADGIPLPARAKIIGLMNRNKPDCYQGSDFYSRFNRVEHCPLTHKQLDELKPKRQVEITANPPAKATLINLYHDLNWENRLLGQWVLNGDNLSFIEGELTKAIALGQPIQIQNGLWDDPKFQRFWQQVLTVGVRHNEGVIHVPQHLQVSRPELDRYEWNSLPSIQSGPCLDANAKVLNPSSLVNFFGRYEISGTQMLRKSGFIAEAENNTLVVEVTRTLSDDAWARLLDECTRLHVRLEVHCTPGVALPDAFHYDVTEESPPTQGLPEEKINQDLFIFSTDCDTTAYLLKNSYNDAVVIDVSECTPADLFLKIDAKLNQEKDRPHFEFTQSNGGLTTALAADKQIILKGYCSPELLDALSIEIQKRKRLDSAPGQIILISDQQKVGSFMANRYQHEVGRGEKLDCLRQYSGEILDKLAPYLDNEPLSTLFARARYLQTNPQAPNSDEAWLGMSSLPSNSQPPPLFDINTSQDESQAFTQKRLDQVNHVLKSAPYVFITGLSGVGKSTFVEKELSKDSDLYLTEERIEDWAKDISSDKRKILFIDEANLTPRQWSEFEGLFNRPPSILIKGTLYNLTEQHRVVFAGNPVNYGDERRLAPLFQRHGNAVLFSPLPPAVIAEEILKPLFQEIPNITAQSQQEIIARLLAVYSFITNQSTTEVLISPRELQMMALLTIARIPKDPTLNSQDLVNHYSYELAKNLVPKPQRKAFEQQFKPQNAVIFSTPSKQASSDFLVTPSRQTVSLQINDLLELRKWRRATREISLNPAQIGGGLGGLILEGEPGIGKSELVIAGLIAQGFEEERDYEKPSIKENPFYRMPVSMSLKEKEDLLIKAFNEGAVVMIDEINSAPMMERLLNDLLMGKNPKANEEDQVKPGFMIIGTQNPVTMAGRRAPSTALQRRLITNELPEYLPEEMKTILLIKGVEPGEADAMLEAYQKNRAFAVDNHLSPIPNFRDLMNLAEEHYLQRLGVINEKQSILSTVNVTAHPSPHPEHREGSPYHKHRATSGRSLAELGMTGVQLQPNLESAPDYLSMIDHRVKNGESRHVILSEIETELDAMHGQLMSKMIENFNVLLDTIKATKFGDNDVHMNSFITEYTEKLELATNQKNLKLMNDLINKLDGIQTGLQSEANETIRGIIKRFDVQSRWWLCFWYFGSSIKARRIETAMADVPIEERAQLLESKHPAIHGVLTALASHRISYSNPINQNNEIVVKSSANSLKTFHLKFYDTGDTKDDVIPPPNNTPKL